MFLHSRDQKLLKLPRPKNEKFEYEAIIQKVWYKETMYTKLSTIDLDKKE